MVKEIRRLIMALLAVAFVTACTTPQSTSNPDGADRVTGTEMAPSAPAPTQAVTGEAPPTPMAGSEPAEEAQVRAVVEGWGQKLQAVSLLAPNAAQQIQEQYGRYVAPALLQTWMSNVSQAPGRLTSSPWPDRIEIATLAREAPDRYVVTGFVVEVTSAQALGGGAAARIPVRLVVEKVQEQWLITDYTGGR